MFHSVIYNLYCLKNVEFYGILWVGLQVSQDRMPLEFAASASVCLPPRQVCASPNFLDVQRHGSGAQGLLRKPWRPPVGQVGSAGRGHRSPVTTPVGCNLQTAVRAGKAQYRQKTGNYATRQGHDPRFIGNQLPETGRLGWDSRTRESGPSLVMGPAQPMPLARR
jgi:hypothetical protein